MPPFAGPHWLLVDSGPDATDAGRLEGDAEAAATGFGVEDAEAAMGIGTGVGDGRGAVVAPVQEPSEDWQPVPQ